MGSEKNEPEETVHDGVEAGSNHIPREPAEAAADPDGETPAAAETETPPDGSEASDPTGPAQEQDDKTPDTRGLTTDTSPTD